MPAYEQFIAGDDSLTAYDFTAHDAWDPATLVRGRLHAWSAYTDRKQGYAERCYHALRIRTYISDAAARAWWADSADLTVKEFVHAARSLLGKRPLDHEDFNIMLQVQRERAANDAPFVQALSAWTSGHIVELNHRDGDRWGIDPESRYGRNLMGIILMRVAKETA